MLFRISFLFFLFQFSYNLFAQNINGVVVDSVTNTALPFASVGFTIQLTGTVCNTKGEFEIINKDSTRTDTIQINFIGYELYKIPVSTMHGSLIIKLKPTSVIFNQVLIEPKEPIWYIKEAIKQRAVNYPIQSFQTIAYYNEVMKENNHYTKFTEAVVKSNHSAYTDTAKSIHQLLLFKASAKIEEMQFMQAKMQKNDKKRKKKAEKKGEVYDKKSEAVTASFGGPSSILAMDKVKLADEFLDSTRFQKYVYSFKGASTYRNLDVIIIAFKSKKTLDHMRQKGKIYLDANTNSIVAIDFYGNVVIPIAAKPFLFVMGLKIENPRIVAKVRYEQIDSTWFPQIFQIKLNGEFTKKYTFKENEFADFEIEQVLSINKITPSYTTPIPKEKRFNVKEEMPKQVYNDEGFEWSDIDVMKVSY